MKTENWLCFVDSMRLFKKRIFRRQKFLKLYYLFQMNPRFLFPPDPKSLRRIQFSLIDQEENNQRVRLSQADRWRIEYEVYNSKEMKFYNFVEWLAEHIWTIPDLFSKRMMARNMVGILLSLYFPGSYPGKVIIFLIGILLILSGANYHNDGEEMGMEESGKTCEEKLICAAWKQWGYRVFPLDLGFSFRTSVFFSLSLFHKKILWTHCFKINLWVLFDLNLFHKILFELFNAFSKNYCPKKSPDL